jgi:hypothetical protein
LRLEVGVSKVSKSNVGKSGVGKSGVGESGDKSKKLNPSYFARHSLSIVSGAILALWIGLYLASDEHTHLGAFYGNAIADWSGLLVTVLATKVMYEIGSAESKSPPRHFPERLWDLVREHSLTLFLVATGLGWAVLYARMNPDGKWGQVVGNIVSEWTQILGLVVLTKRLIERGSRESK